MQPFRHARLNRALPALLVCATGIVAIGATAVSGSTTLALVASFIALALAASYLGALILDARRPDSQSAQSAAGMTDTSWRVIIDAMADAAIVLSGSGHILHSSRAARELFPRLREGQPITQVSRNPELLAAVEHALETRAARAVQSLERVPIERRLAVTISPLRSARHGEDAPSLLLVFRDVSEEERLAQMRSDFIANASHELRTPLTSLRGFIETLQGPARDDPVARNQFLDIMSAQAGRMSRLLDDLLSLSRVEMRAHVPPRGEVEINEIVREVFELLQPIAAEAGIALTCAPAAAACPVRGDRDELVQVFQNLIQNAIKYGQRGGHVDVRVTREKVGHGLPDRIAIEIRDDGPGIAEEHLPRLTERFYRVDVAESRDKGGTGLGLAIVKHVLNRHHGQLRIQSKLGVGSTFTVLLDLIPSARAPAPGEPVRARAGAAARPEAT